jgi:thiol:disulfide interchange protein DsbD
VASPIPFLTLATLLAAAPVLAVGTGVQRGPHIEAELISAVRTVAPGHPFTVALRLQPDPHWHTYWRNPGDTGLETRIEWHLPEGAAAGPIRWPTPQRFASDGLVSFGYEGETWLLTEITPPTPLRPGATFTVAADARWLVCREECIPGSARFSLALPVAAQTAASPQQARFAAAAARLPQPRDWPATFSTAADSLTLTLQPEPAELAAAGDSLQLLPLQPALVEYLPPLRVERDGGALRLRQPLNAYFRQAPPQFEAVIIAGDEAYAIRARAD